MASSDIQQYPFQFDPSQWANKYSPYAGVALPWPSSYAGVPTDAHGNPIQSYLDAQSAAAAPPPTQAPPVSLNSTPAAATVGSGTPGWQPMGVGGAVGWNPGAGAQQPGRYVMTNPGGQYTGGAAGDQAVSQRAGTMAPAQYQYIPAPQQQRAPQAAAPAGPDMSQAYLAALSNPGHVTTPGATVAQAPTPTGQSGVLQQFLANWKPTTGAGNYNNQGFYNALQGQV
jgi:hypothetical protein